MFYNKELEPLYSNIMLNIKDLNRDWITLRNSKQYRVGLVLLEISKDLRHLRIKRLYKSIKKWIRGKRSDSVKSYINVKIEKNTPNYFSAERIAVYTAIFGNYDKPISPYCYPDNCDYYIFTDQIIDKDSPWKILETPELIGMSNTEKNRYLKMHPHKLFPEYKYSVYVDGNVQIVTDLTECINKLNSSGIGIHRHAIRNCIYKELEAIVKTNRMSTLDAQKFVKYAQEFNMPNNYGLLQCSVIAREHNNPVCIKIMEEWWRLFSCFGKRDQLYLPLALYMNGIQIDEVAVLGDNLYANPSFRVIRHQ